MAGLGLKAYLASYHDELTVGKTAQGILTLPLFTLPHSAAISGSFLLCFHLQISHEGYLKLQSPSEPTYKCWIGLDKLYMGTWSFRCLELFKL